MHPGMRGPAAGQPAGERVTPRDSGSSVAREAVQLCLREAIVDLGLAGRRLVVAASGGVDSTVLAHALWRCADVFDLELSLVHVNHRLRGDESDSDEAFVAELAERLRVPFACERVDPRAAREGKSSRIRPTLQEAARSLRYSALEELRRKAGASVVLTAHNADDQAETVLLRLLRGSGPDGLGGIPEVSRDGTVLRPLLRASRGEIVAHAEAHQLRWREDASNLDCHYARNRLRREWLPGLARDFNPQLLRTIGNLAEAHRRDAEWLSSLVEQEAERIFSRHEGALWIDSEAWKGLPEALARRLAQSALRELGLARELTRVHLVRVLAFLDTRGTRRVAKAGTMTAQGGRILELPRGVRIARELPSFRLYRVGAGAHARLEEK